MKPRKTKSHLAAIVGTKEYKMLWDPRTFSMTLWRKGSRRKLTLSISQILDAAEGQMTLPLGASMAPGTANPASASRIQDQPDQSSPASTLPRIGQGTEYGTHSHAHHPETDGTCGCSDCRSDTLCMPEGAQGFDPSSSNSESAETHQPLFPTEPVAVLPEEQQPTP